MADCLNTLGFRTVMKEHPALLDALFVPSTEKMNTYSILAVLKFPKNMDDTESNLAGFNKMQRLTHLEKFLRDFGLSRIQVKFCGVPSNYKVQL